MCMFCYTIVVIGDYIMSDHDDTGELADLPLLYDLTDMEPNKERIDPMVYSYTDPQDIGTPLNHMIILGMRMHGVPNKQIANTLGVSSRTVSKVLAHGPNRRYLRSAIDRCWKSRLLGMERITRGFVGVIDGMIDDTDHEDARIRSRARDSYMKALTQLMPLNFSSAGDADFIDPSSEDSVDILQLMGGDDSCDESD